MGLDLIMVGHSRENLCDEENRAKEKCKASTGEALLKDLICPWKVTILEMGYVADTRNDVTSTRPSSSQHRPLCQIPEREGRKANIINLGMEGSVFKCYDSIRSP